MGYGRVAPLKKVQNPNIRAITALPAVISLMVTFDPQIKTMKDLAGKKVGVSERARVFQNDLANRPYFDKDLGIWDKIKCEYLGSINSKDAILNRKIDVKQSYFYGNVEVTPDGTNVCTKLLPETPNPIGIPKQLGHPGMEKVMINLGLQIPQQ